MNFNVNKNVFMRFTLLVGSIFSVTHAMNELTPIGRALLIDQIEKHGVDSVRGAMRDPETICYRDSYGCKDKTILKVEIVLKKDESNPLAHMMFAKVKEFEDKPHMSVMGHFYGKDKLDEFLPLTSQYAVSLYWWLESSCRYAWIRKLDQPSPLLLPTIVVKASLYDKEAIEEVLNSYKQ